MELCYFVTLIGLTGLRAISSVQPKQLEQLVIQITKCCPWC